MEKKSVNTERNLLYTVQTAGIVLFILLVTFLFLQNSPLSIWRGGETGTDSSVFRTVALMMRRGGMPYRDTFDHKGPLLFILNYVGSLISYHKGVWVIELLVDFIAFLILYKIARLCCGKTLSLCCMLGGISLLFEYFEAGNLTEEYAMVFIAGALYIFLDYFLNDQITKLRLVLCGFCLGGVCLLRPNMISVWVVFCIAVLVQCVQRKTWSDLSVFIVFFLVGFLMIVIPVLIWLGMNDALLPCFEDYILFNFAYASDPMRASFGYKYISFFTFCQKTIVMIALLSAVWMCTCKKKLIGITCLSSLLLTLLLICISGQTYGHYGMVLVPVVVFPIASLVSISEKQENCHSIGLILALYLFASLIAPDWIDLLKSTGTYFAERNKPQISGVLQEVCTFIETNTDVDEKISVYGNYNIVYVLTQRQHASKYSYQSPIGSVNPAIMDTYFSDLERELPRMIVAIETDGQFMNQTDRMRAFLSDHEYTEEKRLPYGADSEILVYQRQLP